LPRGWQMRRSPSASRPRSGGHSCRPPGLLGGVARAGGGRRGSAFAHRVLTRVSMRWAQSMSVSEMPPTSWVLSAPCSGCSPPAGSGWWSC
jgi:hypothetical protein